MKLAPLGRKIFLSATMLSFWISTAWAETEGHAEEPGIDRTLLYAAINFFILAGLLVYFLRKPAKEFFASRSTLIKTTIDQATALKAQADQKYRDYEGRMKGIEAEMKGLVEQLKQDGELERKKILEQAERQVLSLKDTTERVLSQELRKAKEELKREATNLASEMAEKLVRENITPQDQNRIVEQYLQKMEKLS